MREKSVVPTSLPDWPRVTALLPEQKLILGLGFWAGRYTNSIGVAVVPVRPLAASLGLDPAALQQGIKTLCQEQLLLADWETSEVFVCDWFRFHVFKGLGVEIAKKEYLKISSRIIAAAVAKASPWLASDPIVRAIVSNQRSSPPTATARGTASSSPATRIRTRRDSGIVTFFQTDEVRASAIEQKHSAETIQTAVSAVEARDKEPVPGLVEKSIEARARATERRNAPAKSPAPSPTVSRDECEKGLMRAWAALSKPAKEGST
ncbi:MAG: hypothetical protein IPO00_04710 [Betaproteobacteria bacterium]|nr:hypothetical protein [Betaproteobacteria bacterium]